MLLIDANIFLEILLDQARAQECEDFLKNDATKTTTQQEIDLLRKDRQR